MSRTKWLLDDQGRPYKPVIYTEKRVAREWVKTLSIALVILAGFALVGTVEAWGFAPTGGM